jgi:iron complex transport system permease protein
MKNYASIITLLIIALIALAFAGCILGTAGVMFDVNYIVLHIRLPRVLMAIVSGAGLSVCGVAYQAIFRNPLSDPYIIGVSSGASLGAALAIIIGLDTCLWGISALSFATALGSVFVIIGIASVGNRLHTTTLLLAGISLNFLIAAVISLLMILNQQDMDKIIFWTMGSLASATFENVAITSIFVIAGVVIILLYGRDLNAMLLGRDTAQNVGINVERTKKTILLFSTLMIAVIVSFTGVIGFVGLVVPHIVRLVVGGDNRRLLPVSLLGGSLAMLAADLVARIAIPPSELPIGSITALFGAPLFIYLLFNAKKRLSR